MEKVFGVVHCIAYCLNCKWSADNYKNAQAVAAKHAKHYKHKVSVEVGIGGYYDGRMHTPKEKK